MGYTLDIEKISAVPYIAASGNCWGAPAADHSDLDIVQSRGRPYLGQRGLDPSTGHVRIKMQRHHRSRKPVEIDGQAKHTALPDRDHIVGDVTMDQPPSR